jgi:pimeloyl-ACP methyl ester carboxylesterase
MDMKSAFKTEEGKLEIRKVYDEALERWFTPNEKFYVETRAGETFVTATGDKEAPPLILLHGSCMNSLMWLGDVPKLSERYRVYAVDIPGEPGKSDERQLPFTGTYYSDWLSDVYQALSIDQAGLVGISLGGWIALKYSVTNPERVSKLVLLCPGGIGPQKKLYPLQMLFYLLLGKKGEDIMYRKLYGNQPVPEEVHRYQKLIGNNFNFRKELLPIFADGEIRRLTMPVTLFAGDQDIVFHTDQMMKRLERLVPEAKINILPGAGHALIHLTEKILTALDTK